MLSRGIVAGSLAAFSPRLAGTGIELVDERTTDARRVRGEWVRAPGAVRDDAVILYIHGSGYVYLFPAHPSRFDLAVVRLHRACGVQF